YLQDNRVACEMGLYYVLHIAKLRNKNALQRLLPALVETYNDMAFGDIFLHLLTGHLTLLSDEFGSEEFCTVCSEPLKELHSQLTEKLEAQKKSPAPPDESSSLDLGLHPVTVPTTTSVPTTPL
ncbi:hypothetical protein GOODEAATRI_024379, partial [Goodea atripinnis]